MFNTFNMFNTCATHATDIGMKQTQNMYAEIKKTSEQPILSQILASSGVSTPVSRNFDS